MLLKNIFGKSFSLNNESTILFNKGYEEYENKKYAASLKYYFDSERRDDSTYHNISLCYYILLFIIMKFI